MEANMKRIEEEYERNVSMIMRKNRVFVRRNPVLLADFPNQQPMKIVIPQIEASPPYRYFVNTKINITGTDDPVLRFVPYINDEKGYTTIMNYNGTSLTENPLTKDEAIKNLFLKKVFSKFDDMKLHDLKKKFTEEKLAEIKDTREYITLKSLAIFLKTSVSKLLTKWESEFDKRAKPLYPDVNSFIDFFCNVCLIFDCNIHTISSSKIPQEGETSDACICADECYLSISNVSLQKYKVSSDFALKKVRTNKYIALSDQEKRFIAKIKENYDFVPCDIVKVLKYALGSDVSCRMVHLYLTQYKTRTLIHNYKKTGTIAPSKYNIKYFEFYQPCNHLGACYRNKDCPCYNNKVYCESMCFCTECDLLANFCKCKICTKCCACKTHLRECSDRCRCTGCSNNGINTIHEKNTYVAPSTIEGYGLFAAENLCKDDFIIEYVGEVITNDEAERRGLFYEKRKLSYLFDLSNLSDCTNETIDATKIANKARFINHSKNANLIAQTMQVDGRKRIGFYARRNIEKDEELFFDYRYKEEQKKNYKIKEF